jgi:alpha-glucosidase
MHFHKFPYPANFEYPAKPGPGKFRTAHGVYQLRARAAADDIYHLQVTGPGWEENDSQAGLSFVEGKGLAGETTRLLFSKTGGVRLEDAEGKAWLEARAGEFFGQCGPASLFQFDLEEGCAFYGMGEKWTGLEHSGKTSKFWNTDVWGDFPPSCFELLKPAPDPVYLSVPYVIVKRGNFYVGLLLDNPHATFISTNYRTVESGVVQDSSGLAQGVAQAGRAALVLGSEAGQPNLYLLYGPSLPELTRKLQRLVGTTPLPPAWALGAQQCRWGYDSEEHLRELDAGFRRHKMPADGLWLDIEYMDRYKVFSFSKKHFPDPKKALASLARRGRRVVAIIDPGVKIEKGYGVYERGKKARAFCQNPQGGDYVGLVWPGRTAFPDFSLPAVRRWWAREVTAFAKLGVGGAWLDMNDPSTGPVENHDMLFAHGRRKHGSYHNQYALGMAMASREGFLAARPGERPFLLSRSGFTGSSRYTAIWTGDNFSNYAHLKGCIATTLNLALSGIPFNGPDVGGFGGNTTAALMEAWHKAGFLFPFFRNHSMANTRRQEPWAFGKKTTAILRRYLQLRYRLRPYLYQLFVEQERSGEAIMRPLFYDLPDDPALPLGRIDDQFMIGPHVMQAPFVEEEKTTREVVLPNPARWFALAENQWHEGGRKIRVKADAVSTPIFVREGAILPLARLEPAEHVFRPRKIDFHIFLAGDGEALSRYVFDDGLSFAYQKGKRSEVEIRAALAGAKLEIGVTQVRVGYGRGDFTFTTLPGVREVTVNNRRARRTTPQGVALGVRKAVTWIVPA